MPVAARLDILICDDQSAMRNLVRASLFEMGVNVVRECHDGEEALRELSIRPAHLVISDLNMPKMDGLALLKAVRANPRMAKTAFILLTSRGEVELVKKAIALGVNNYVRKPFTMGDLRKKIEAVLGPLT
jgi:two-component system chemotaxis response regulator CheY